MRRGDGKPADAMPDQAKNIPRAPISAAFYAIGADRPTILAYPRSWFDTWPALSSALANHYAADAESFHTVEAYWNGDREFAEVVTLDGEIIGAVDRPISAADIAAIRGVRLVEKRALINRIRSLFNIEGFMLPELTPEQQSVFVRDPLGYFLNADEAQSDAIFREVESRQKGEASVAEPSVAAELKVTKSPRAKKAKPRIEGQREMLLPIAGGKVEAEGKPGKVSTARRKAG